MWCTAVNCPSLCSNSEWGCTGKGRAAASAPYNLLGCEEGEESDKSDNHWSGDGFVLMEETASPQNCVRLSAVAALLLELNQCTLKRLPLLSMLCLLGLLCFKLSTCRSHSCSCIRPCTWRWLRLHSCGSCTTPAELGWPVLHGYSKDAVLYLDRGTMQSETPCLAVYP